MAKGKKQDIGDIIRDIMSAMSGPKRSGRPVKLQRRIPKPPNEQKNPRTKPSVRTMPLRPRKPSTRSGPQPMPRKVGDKPFDREKAILPRRPRNPRKPTGPRAEFPKPMVEGQKRYPAYNVQPSRRRTPKRKPKAGPKRGAKY